MGTTFTITELITLLKRWRWTLIIVPLSCLLVAAVLVFYVIPPTYEASTTLLVARNVTSDQPTTLRYEDLLLSQELAQTYGEIVKSWTVSHEVTQFLGLPLTYDQFKKKVNVTLVSKTQIIRISVYDRDPALAERIANTTATAFSERVPELLKLNNVAVLDPARTPDNPVKPKKTMMITVAGVVGFMLTLAYALASEYMDRRIRDSSVAERVLDLPVLGTIPKGNPANGGGGTTSYIPLLDSPRSPVAEAYRSLRTNVQFYCGRIGAQVISVTSALPLEGKTTLAVNLSIGIAQTGKRVTLIDADLRRPTVHKVMGLINDRGLFDLLTGSSESPDELLGETPIMGLSVLTSGTIPPNPAELLEGSRFADVINYLRKVSDYVVIDTPPITAVTDAAIISSISDGVLLATSSTRQRIAIRAKAALEQVNAKIMGVILNQVTAEADQYSGYYSS